MFAQYAAEMGRKRSAVEWMIERQPDKINILTKAQADRLGIAVDL